MRVTLRTRDRRIVSGFAPGFNPSEGGLMITTAPESPAGTMYLLVRVEVLVLEPTDGSTLPLPPSRQKGGASPALRLVFPDGEELVGHDGVIAPGTGVWMRPPDDESALVFVPEGAAPQVELLADKEEPPPEMWAFVADASPTDEVELPGDFTPTTPSDIPTDPSFES
jgi:hypothetical protein